MTPYSGAHWAFVTVQFSSSLLDSLLTVPYLTLHTHAHFRHSLYHFLLLSTSALPSFLFPTFIVALSVSSCGCCPSFFFFFPSFYSFHRDSSPSSRSFGPNHSTRLHSSQASSAAHLPFRRLGSVPRSCITFLLSHCVNRRPPLETFAATAFVPASPPPHINPPLGCPCSDVLIRPLASSEPRRPLFPASDLRGVGFTFCALADLN